MHDVPVHELMCQDSFNFVRLAFLNQGVKDDDVLALRPNSVSVICASSSSDRNVAYPRKAKEVCVRVRRALRAVDLVQVLERELELGREPLDAGAEVALGERRELVEQRLDDGRVEHDHRQLEDQPVRK